MSFDRDKWRTTFSFHLMRDFFLYKDIMQRTNADFCCFSAYLLLELRINKSRIKCDKENDDIFIYDIDDGTK